MKINLLITISLLTFLVEIIPGCSDKKETQQPNILFIMTDDHTQ